jgi:nucleoside-diphosphate-sugar epimerase
VRLALVTGATGLLGSYIVERLLAAGWSVRGLLRASSPGALAPGAQPVAGDVTDSASLHAAAKGCDAIFHAAARIGPGSDWRPFHLGNVVGTENVLAAAAAAGSRVVHVSSTSVFGRQRYYATPTDESRPLPELPERDAYGRSKQAAERIALAAHGAGRVWATVVRPPVMYGVGDRQFVPRLGRLLRWGLCPLVGDGRCKLTLVHADSVAEGAIRAAGRDVAGGRVYHLTNDFELTVAELVRYAALGLRRRVLAVRVPKGPARLAFRALAVALRAGGRSDLAAHARGTFEMLTLGNPFTSERAHRELGWCPVIAPAVGLPEAFSWWSRSVGPAAGNGPRPGS